MKMVLAAYFPGRPAGAPGKRFAGFRLLSRLLLPGALLLSGCAATQPELTALDDSEAFETLPMIALEGYRDDTNFYVRYRLGGRLYYAGGNWRERVQLVETPPAENYAAPTLMLEQGIRVYIYPGFSHVKAAIYDGWACVGSANFDRLSLHLNRELNIASSAADFSSQVLERLFEPDFQAAPELTEPISERWVDHLVEIVGDYLY